MQKRVGLARAVVASPKILYFDEPTTGLDPINADVINQLIIEQVRRLGCAAVSITHDLVSARAIGDEIAMLHAGRIIWRGRPEELERSGDPRVEQFVAGRADGPLTETAR
jgi:phospholipid/cholesterol/gamma-HCH transport system ATP-binding protein